MTLAGAMQPHCPLPESRLPPNLGLTRHPAFEAVGFGVDAAHLFICLPDAVCPAVYLIIIRKASRD